VIKRVTMSNKPLKN